MVDTNMKLRFLLFRVTDAVQQKWLARIILRNLGFGLGETTILNTMHPDGKVYLILIG